MTTPRRYNTPEAFKQALETRLRGTGNMNRARQILIMERFYGRIHALMGDSVIVKGGMVLEQRLDRARTTKDLDLRLTGNPEALLALLQEAARQPFGDFLTFTVEPDPAHETIDGDGMVYEGRRYRVTAQMAGKVYGA
ncbi:MAG: nucleotidyl transferase AbiEii/AbiGii toxin family protein, partial [Candidatus Sericytochromatia bacterium]